MGLLPVANMVLNGFGNETCPELNLGVRQDGAYAEAWKCADELEMSRNLKEVRHSSRRVRPPSRSPPEEYIGTVTPHAETVQVRTFAIPTPMGWIPLKACFRDKNQDR
jgi:hypothetical protein